MAEVAEQSIVGNKYLLLEKLSEGGGGVVWKARRDHQKAQAGQTNLFEVPEGKEVALKVLKWTPLKSKEATADRFKREFELFKKVSHPNIAKIYDFGFDEKHQIYYFTSELLVGGDLRKMIGTPLEVVERLLLESLRTLEYLRNFGILHLDIKPQNLLLRPGPEVALIDFGLAGFNPPERPGGTPNYMPPEIVLKRLGLTETKEILSNTDISEFGAPDHRSDLYSLGVTFYFILSGELPFAVLNKAGRVDVKATMLCHLQDATPPPPSFYSSQVPSYLDAIIMRMMSRYPNERYQTALLAQQALCFRSPHKLKPETRETISAYLPEEGMLIGRHDEKRTLEKIVSAVAKGENTTTVVCIAGPWGTGKTRLLHFLTPLAQKNEMEVVGNLRVGTLEFKRPMAFLLDDPLMSAANIDISSFSDTYALKQLIQTVKSLPKAKCLVVFTVNTDLSSTRDIYSLLGMEKSDCKIIDLKNFTNSELNEYVTYLLGEEPSSKIIDELNQVTFGNPRFIADLFKRMMQKGELFSYFSGRPGADTLSSLGFSFSHTSSPPSLAEFYLDKIGELPRGAQDLAYRLACWQRPVSVDELDKVGEKTSEDDLAALLSSGLIKRTQEEEGLFSFSNPLAGKIIESNLDLKKRAAIHDKIADYLKSPLLCKPALSETEGAGAGEVDRECTFELHRHLAFGSNIEAQRESVKIFAVESLKSLHPSATAEILHSLFEAIPKEEWRSRSQALIREGQALARMGRFKEAKNTFERLRKLSTDEEAALELNLRANELLGFLALRRRDLAAARDIFTKTLNLVKNKPQDDPRSKMKLLRLENYLAGINMREGRYKEAADVYERTAKEALKLPKEYKDRITNNELGETYISLGKLEEAIEIIKEDLKWAKSIDHRERTVNQLRLLGDAYRRKGDYSLALKNYWEVLDLARKYYLFEHQLRIQNSLANLLLHHMKWNEAIEQYKPALDLAMRLEGRATAVDIMTNVGFAYNKLGQFDDAIEYLELALDFAKGPEAKSLAQVKRIMPHIHVALGHAHYEKKELDKAEEHLNIALGYNRKEKLDNLTLYNLNATLAEIDLARGNSASAKERLPKLKELVKEVPEAKEHLKGLVKQIS